jgi:predicted DNA-binding transcriptional regulator AlpA
MVSKSTTPDINFLSYKQIAARIGNPSRETIARWIRHGSFPKPVRLGAVGGRIAWRETDIVEWMTTRCPR